jgi:hypothetical protein
MTQQGKRSFKIISLLSIVFTTGYLLYNLFLFMKTPADLSNPLIPESARTVIARPYLYTAIILLPFVIISYLFHRKEKYFFSTGICLLAFLAINYLLYMFL